MITRIFTKTILPEKLDSELKAAVGDTLFDSVNYEADISQVIVNLKIEPSSSEDQTIVDTVNNHVPSYPLYKIWDYVNEPPFNKWHSPTDLDYKKGLNTRLHPKNTFEKGEMKLREYYATATPNPDGSINFTDLVLKEENDYTRDVAGFAISRQQTISWYRDDSTWGPDQKITLKYYDGIDKIQEGQTRRGNLVDSLMMDAANMLIYNETVARRTALADPNYDLTAEEIETQIQRGRALMTEYEDFFSAFVQHSDKEIITKIDTDPQTTHTFLGENIPDQTKTFEQYIIEEMTI